MKPFGFGQTLWDYSHPLKELQNLQAAGQTGSSDLTLWVRFRILPFLGWCISSRVCYYTLVAMATPLIGCSSWESDQNLLADQRTITDPCLSNSWEKTERI